MRTPIDATGFPGATVALLNGGAPFCMADLYTITLSGGGVVRWTNNPTDLAFNGNVWSAGPVLTRGKIAHKVGTEVSTVEITLAAAPTDLINGVPILPFIAAKGFDGASFKLERAFLPAWVIQTAPEVDLAIDGSGDLLSIDSGGDALIVSTATLAHAGSITGTLIDFAGYVTSIKTITRASAVITASSGFVRLNVNMGPDLYQSSCLNVLFDGDCGLLKASFAVNSTVAGTGAALAFNTALTAADGYYSQGVIQFTSGANAGVKRAIRTYAHASGAMTMSFPLPNAPAAGDAFTVWPGCDHTLATCKGGKFGVDNSLHFRGQPFIPVPETGV